MKNTAYGSHVNGYRHNEMDFSQERTRKRPWVQQAVTATAAAHLWHYSEAHVRVTLDRVVKERDSLVEQLHTAQRRAAAAEETIQKVKAAITAAASQSAASVSLRVAAELDRLGMQLQSEAKRLKRNM